MVNSAWRQRLECGFYVRCSRSVNQESIRGGRSRIDGRARFPHRLAGHFQLDAMALVHQAIQDRVGQRGFAEIGMPRVDGKLTRDKRRSSVDSVIEDLEQIGSVLRA